MKNGECRPNRHPRLRCRRITGDEYDRKGARAEGPADRDQARVPPQLSALSAIRGPLMEPRGHTVLTGGGLRVVPLRRVSPCGASVPAQPAVDIAHGPLHPLSRVLVGVTCCSAPPWHTSPVLHQDASGRRGCADSGRSQRRVAAGKFETYSRPSTWRAHRQRRVGTNIGERSSTKGGDRDVLRLGANDRNPA
jgi:hypothetical protein